MAEVRAPHVAFVFRAPAWVTSFRSSSSRSASSSTMASLPPSSLTPTSTPLPASTPSPSPPSISTLSLPSVPLHDLPPGSRIETYLSVLSTRSAPSVVDLLLSLKRSTNLVAYVTDMFGVDTLPITKDLGVPRYILFTSSYFMLSFMFHLPTLHETTSCEFRDLPEPLTLPGCIPLSGDDFFDPVSDRTDKSYPLMVQMARLFGEADGILVNSFIAFEPETARAMSEEKVGRPPVYTVGPIVRSGSADSGSECVKWLDAQPRGSVLFVSFGSGWTIKCRQTEELAMGLELSGQKFLWVVRIPSDSEPIAFLGSRTASDDPKDYLPDGFLSRTRTSGFVIANWAPQMEVLAHIAVGGFLSHCGWNSSLESATSGVPMIAWPLYAEQRMNAAMLSEGAKIALWPKTGENGVVGREEICRVVKELMEGAEGRAAKNRVLQLQKAGKDALGKNGSSCSVLAAVVNKWKESCLD